jgi:hypothetical protein
MLRLHTAGPAPTKNPRCRWQARERVGDELGSADTLTYEEDRSFLHAATIAAAKRESIRAASMSCDPEGRSDALLNEGVGAT